MLLRALLASLALAIPAGPAAAQPAPGPGDFAAALPASGIALTIWGGGPAAELAAGAARRGCTLASAWATVGGALLGYLPGAPAFVNAPFVARFGAGIAAGTPLVAVCRAAPPAAVAGAARAIGASDCTLFPDDNAWATKIADAPLHPNSSRYIGYILGLGGTGRLHPDFGANPAYGIPYTIVPADQPGVPVTFDYADESDPGPYPIPPGAPVEAGADSHVLVVRQGECKLYELFAARRNGAGWHAGSGAIFDLRSNALRPNTWTSADAAGLPIFAGLVRYDEVQAGRIDHALRFTVSRTQRGFIHPATHYASTVTDPSAPPMGLRLRLSASYDISRFTGASRVVLQALRDYGMIVADNGSNWFISGATDPRWNDADLGQLKTVPGSAFEVVDTGPVLTR